MCSERVNFDYVPNFDLLNTISSSPAPPMVTIHASRLTCGLTTTIGADHDWAICSTLFVVIPELLLRRAGLTPSSAHERVCMRH